MQGSGQQRFAGTAFARDQNAGIAVSQASDHMEKAEHYAALGHQSAEHGDVLVDIGGVAEAVKDDVGEDVTGTVCRLPRWRGGDDRLLSVEAGHRDTGAIVFQALSLAQCLRHEALGAEEFVSENAADPLAETDGGRAIPEQRIHVRSSLADAKLAIDGHETAAKAAENRAAIQRQIAVFVAIEFHTGSRASWSERRSLEDCC